MKNNIDIGKFASQKATFDLQFRKDTRHERTNAPTYYRWKVQFIITAPKDDTKLLKKVQKEIGCGNVNVVKNQSRFSVQNVADIKESVIPFLKKHALSGDKKKEFELWQRAVNIILENKGKYILTWKKNDLASLIQIHKLTAKYKNRTRKAKWVEMAQTYIKKS